VRGRQGALRLDHENIAGRERDGALWPWIRPDATAAVPQRVVRVGGSVGKG